MVNNIVLFTNSYADNLINHPLMAEHLIGKLRSVFQLWTPVNKDEIWAYLCVCFLMGITKKTEYPLYWSTNSPHQYFHD